MPNFVSTANFSAANAGLATVGYKIFNLDGSQYAARTTSGVVELGTSTGIYRTIVTYPPFFQGFVLWDTGGATPVYASESINPQDADPVLDGVRTQLRSLNTSLSAYLQKQFGKDDASKLFKKLESLNPEKLDLSSITDGLAKLEAVIKELEVKPVIDFKPQINPEVNVDLKPLESLIQEFRKEAKLDMNSSLKSALDQMKSECRQVVKELSRIEADQGKKADLRLASVNNAMKQMLSSFEKRLLELSNEMEKKHNDKQNYEKKLADIKDNIKELLGASVDVKKQETKLNEEAVKFLMAIGV